MTRLVICGLLCTLSACTMPVAVKPPAPDVHVDPACPQACDTSAPTITTDGNSLVQALYDQHDELVRCEARRALCAQALTRAQAAGAIK